MPGSEPPPLGMSEAEGDTESEAAERPRELFFVFAGSDVNSSYEVGVLTVGEGKTVAVILVASLDERTLAVFPRKAWGRKAKELRIVACPRARSKSPLSWK